MQHGWEMKDGIPMPAVADVPVAPRTLLDVVNCQYKGTDRACTSGACSCRKVGLPCTSYCCCEGGEACVNKYTNNYNEDVDNDGNATDD